MKKNKKQKTTAKNTVINPAEVKAPVTDNTEKQEDTKQTIDVIDTKEFAKNINGSSVGLDANHQVDLLKTMHETFRMDPHAAEKYKMSQDAVDKINRITAIGQVTILANEAMFAKTPFAITLKRTQLDAFKEIASEVGITIDQKALPKPEENKEIVEIQSSAIKVEPETKKKLQKEHKILTETAPVMDVTKFTSKEDLKKALVYLLSKRTEIFNNIQASIDLYLSYATLQANKSNNKDAELEKIKKLSRVDVLSKVADIVEEAPVVINGIGNFMLSITGATKTPVSAFCHFRNTAVNRQTGVSTVDDQFIADIAKVLMIWASKLRKKSFEKSINDINKNLEVLNTDKEKNIGAINEQKDKLETMKKNLEYVEATCGYINNPSVDVIENFIERYDNNDSLAYNIFKSITDSYYSKIDIKAVRQDDLKKNVQEYAGIIVNMFRDPLAQLIAYNKSNLVELKPRTVENSEKTEEVSKN